MAAAEGAAASGAGAAAVIYLERGTVCAARMIGRGERNCRVAEGGGARKLALDRVLAEMPAGEAAAVAERANELAAGLHMERLWELAAGRRLAAAEMAGLAFEQEGLAGAIAVRAAQAGDSAYFRLEGDAFAPVSADAAAAVAAGRAARQQARARAQRMFADMDRGQPPAAIAEQALAFLRGEHEANSISYRLLRKFCSERGEAIPRMCLQWGLVPDELALHLHATLGGLAPVAAADDPPPGPRREELPLLAEDAFSIDGAGTMEIDDAFSVEPLAGGRWRIGIHIAAPGVGLSPAAQLQAEQRKTTIYLPDRKHMLMPDQSVAAYALADEGERLSVSLMQEYDPASGERTEPQLAFGRIGVAANLALDEFIGWQPGRAGTRSDQLAVLSSLCKRLPEGRKPYALKRAFLVRVQPQGDPHILPRASIEGIDALVAALMVHYNRMVARALRVAGVARLLRSEGRNITRTGQAGGPDDYAWASSPLRRFVDLCNQQQLLAVLAGDPAPHSADELSAHARDYELRHAAARHAQQVLEKYWSLRWLALREGKALPATVAPDGRHAHLHEAPLSLRVAGPSREPGSAVDVVADGIDLCMLTASCTVQ